MQIHRPNFCVVGTAIFSSSGRFLCIRAAYSGRTPDAQPKRLSVSIFAYMGYHLGGIFNTAAVYMSLAANRPG